MTQETSRSSGEKQNWTIERLPAGTDLTKWNLCIVPRFIRYFACFGQPWDANKYLDYAQKVWQKIFPESRLILTGKNDAVYPLVCYFRYFRVPGLISFILVTPTHI